MKTILKGGKDPEISVVGLLHGDEPAGKKAIERIVEEDIEFRKPVKFVIANEEARKRDQRYIDSDLNRSFPGDSFTNMLTRKCVGGEMFR